MELKSIRVDKHISKEHGRTCAVCNDKIKYGDYCFTKRLSFCENSKVLVESYHINCVDVKPLLYIGMDVRS